MTAARRLSANFAEDVVRSSPLTREDEAATAQCVE